MFPLLIIGLLAWAFISDDEDKPDGNKPAAEKSDKKSKAKAEPKAEPS